MSVNVYITPLPLHFARVQPAVAAPVLASVWRYTPLISCPPACQLMTLSVAPFQHTPPLPPTADADLATSAAVRAETLGQQEVEGLLDDL
jgi:hypothetical protein